MTFIRNSHNKERLNSFFQRDGAGLSSLAEKTPTAEKLISNDKSIGTRSLNRKSTPPTTPSTVSCNSPDVAFATPDVSMTHDESESEESIIADSPIKRQLDYTSPDPSTVSCSSNSPDVVFATPDVSMEHEESELDESVTDSPIERQLDHTSPDKPSNHPSVTAVSTRDVSADRAFKFSTRAALPKVGLFEAIDAEIVDNIIAGKYRRGHYRRGHLMPPRKTSEKTLRDLVKLSRSFQDNMEKCEEGMDQGIEQEMQQLYERLATYSEKVPPAKEESSKPTKVVFGMTDDAQVSSRSTEEFNHMLEEWPITSLSTTGSCDTDVEVSLISATDEKYESSPHHTGSCAGFKSSPQSGSCAGIETDEVQMGERPEEITANVDHPKCPELADRDRFAISEMAYGYKDEERNSIAEEGESCADPQTGHIAVDAINESGGQVEVSPWYCFSNLNKCTDPRADSESETFEEDADSIVLDSFIAEEVSRRFSHFDNRTDPQADSESEMSEVKGTKFVIDSDSSVFDSFIAEEVSRRFTHFGSCTVPGADSESETSEVSEDSIVFDSSFITDETSSWMDEEKSNSSETYSIEGPPEEDDSHILSDLRATFARVGRELDHKLNCMSEGNGLQSIDSSDSIVSGSFTTEYSSSTWNDYEEKTMRTKDVKHILRDLGVGFVKVGSKLGQRLSLSDYSKLSKYRKRMKTPLPNRGENTMEEAPWLSTSGDFNRTISRFDKNSLFDDRSAQDMVH